MSKQSFADLGVSSAVARALAADGAERTLRRTAVRDSRRPRRPRRAGEGAHRLGQDARLRRADGRAPRGRGRARSRAGAGAHPRAGHAGGRGAHPGGPRAGPVAGHRLRRGWDREAVEARSPRAHPRRHAGPPGGPDRARRRAARPREHPGPRRGRPHARHGLPAARRPDRGADPGRASDALPLRHARGRRRADRRAPTRASPVSTRSSRARRPVAAWSTASSVWPTRRS